MSLSSLGLDALFAIARSGSFTKAAGELRLTQSALSQRIFNLEEELGTTLIVRDRGELRMTPEGASVLRYCRIRAELEDELMSAVNPADKLRLGGALRIGGFSSVTGSVIVPSLAPLLRENPAIRLSVLQREIRELPRLLRRGEIDYMVLDHAHEHEDLEHLLLGYEESVLVVSKRHANAHEKGPETFLDHDEDDPTTDRYLRLIKARTPIRRRFMDDIHGIIDGVKAGIGKAVIPRHLAIRETTELKMIRAERTLRTPVILHYYRMPYYSRLHREALRAIQENASRILAGKI